MTRFWRDKWPETSIVAATVFLFSSKNLFSFLWTSKLAGRDLAGSYAFTWLMHQNLLNGQVFAWNNQWLLGFPSFQLYPPLFFLFTASINLLTGQLLGLIFWFKTIVFLSVFLLPLLTYFMMEKVFGKMEAFFAGFYTLFFVFVYPPVSQAYQVFSTGLVAQGFAFLLFLVSVGFMLREGRKNKIVSGILLGTSALSHPFVAAAGFLLSISLFLLTRNSRELLPAVIGGLLVVPWLVATSKYLPFVEMYTFAPANIGAFFYLLLPLIVIGGYQGTKKKALLTTFFILLLVSAIELPLITQELRFYTYTLGLGSVLAGFGAYRVYQHLNQRINIDHRTVIVALLIPVLGLSLHADLPQSWSFQGEAQPLYDELEQSERGRILVETSNSSIFDSFVLQESIPVETRHWAANDVHLDSSTSANYILTLEAWISEEPLYNPICRTCDSSVSTSLLDERLDDLGVRYVVARTGYSKKLLQRTITYRGQYGDYWLFENSEGYQLIEPLKHRPVALIGSYEKWKQVNDLLFTRNISKEVVWLEDEQPENYSTTIDMRDLSSHETLQKIRDSELEPAPKGSFSHNITDRSIEISADVPVKAKFSYFPGRSTHVKSGKFNTLVLPSGGKIEY